MKSFEDLEQIASAIARVVLKEETDLDPEKDKQDAISDEIDKRDLNAKKSDKESSNKQLTDEAEDEEEDKEDEKIDPKPKPESKDDEDDDKKGFEVKSDTEDIPDNINFDEVKSQINNLRAGGSLKDEDISGQLEDYFDKLGKAETRALYVYLSSVASILTGGTSGTDAPRPEDSGLQLSLDKKKEEEKGSPIPSVESGEQAPILVGEAQNNLKAKMMILESLTANDDHRCINGKIVKFGSPRCVSDIEARLEDAVAQRDSCSRGTVERSSLNGILNFLRQKLRLAHKVSKQ